LNKTSHPRNKAGSETKLLRYHPALVALHWISAVLILVALATCTFWLKVTPNSSPDKIAQLAAHTALGIAILVLTVGRLVMRNIAPFPERASAGHVLLDRLAVATHYALYAAIIFMGLSGIVTAAAADLPAIVFGDPSAPLPESFSNLSPRTADGYWRKPSLPWFCCTFSARLPSSLSKGYCDEFGLARPRPQPANQRTSDKNDKED
jgi:cytochrome b561